MLSSSIFSKTSYIIDKKFPKFTRKYTIISEGEVLGEAVTKKVGKIEVEILNENKKLVAKIIGQSRKITRELKFTDENERTIAILKWKKAFMRNKDYRIELVEPRETLNVVKLHQGHTYEIKNNKEEIISRAKKSWTKNWNQYTVNLQPTINNMNLYALVTILTIISIDLVENTN